MAIELFDSKILCCADTRITTKNASDPTPNPYTDQFSKVSSILGRYFLPDHSSKVFSFGLAFAGSTLIASTISGLVSNLSQNLYSSTEMLPPPFSVVKKIVTKSCELAFEEIKFRDPMPLFSFFVFGMCGRTKLPKAYRIGVTQVTNPVSIEATELFAKKPRAIYSIGTGAASFNSEVSRLNRSKVEVGSDASLPSMVYRAIRSGADPRTGGGITLMLVDENGAQLIPAIVPKSFDDLCDEADCTICGVDIREFGDLEGYEIGSTAIFAGTRNLSNNQWLKRIGFTVTEETTSDRHRNLASLHYMLQNNNGNSIDLRGINWEIIPHFPDSAQPPYMCRCPNCKLLTPVFARLEDNLPEIPFANGSLQTECARCGRPSRFTSSSIKASTKHVGTSNT